MLHSEIATASDLSLVRMSISRPEESVAEYSRLCYPYLTPLGVVLKARFGDIDALSKLMDFARETTSQLGEWCADELWSLALADGESHKIERKIEQYSGTEKENRPRRLIDEELSRLRDAKDFIKNWTFPKPSFEGNGLSPKVTTLLKYLNLVFEKPTDARCIVFVKRRYTAKLLRSLFSQVLIPHLRLGSLIGTRYGDPGDVKISFRQQVLAITKFRKGEINCLVYPTNPVQREC